MQTYAMVGKPKATDILSPPPKSGTMSVYAQKLTALAFVWLCSAVVFGHVVNVAFALRTCAALCRWHLVLGLASWLYTSVLLALNYLTETGNMSRAGCFSHGLEVHLIFALVIPWTLGVFTVSLYGAATRLTMWFAWFAFFGSIYATYKAYHSFKEEDLPSALPEGFDEEDFVYG